MRKLWLIIFYCIGVIHFYAQDMTFAFLGNDKNDIRNIVVMKGARDAILDSELKYNKKFKLINITNSDDLSRKGQVETLGKAFIEGITGVLFIPNEKEIKDFGYEILELQKKNFNIVCLKNNLGKDEFFVGTDKNLVGREIEKEMVSRTKGNEFFTLIIEKSNEESSEIIDEKKLKEYLEKYLDGFEMNSSSIIDKVFFVKAKFYSQFAKKNKKEITRFLNYGIILLNDGLLEDGAEIKKDTNRFYNICLGERPYLYEYLKRGDITFLVAEDYYGYGYLGMKRLLSKVMKEEYPKESQFLKPLKFDHSNKDKFKKNWSEWLN